MKKIVAYLLLICLLAHGPVKANTQSDTVWRVGAAALGLTCMFSGSAAVLDSLGIVDARTSFKTSHPTKDKDLKLEDKNELLVLATAWGVLAAGVGSFYYGYYGKSVMSLFSR